MADLAAFQASDADTLARVGVSAEDAMAVMRILTLASAAAGASSLALEDVAKAVDVSRAAASSLNLFRTLAPMRVHTPEMRAGAGPWRMNVD